MSGTDTEFLQVILKRMHEDVGELLRLHKHTARRLNRIERHLGLTEGMPDENICLELTPREADALWTAANNGRNDFLMDRDAAILYFGSTRGIGNADRAIDKLAKASRGKIKMQPVPPLNYDEWSEKQLRKKLPRIPRKYRTHLEQTQKDALPDPQHPQGEGTIP